MLTDLVALIRVSTSDDFGDCDSYYYLIYAHTRRTNAGRQLTNTSAMI